MGIIGEGFYQALFKINAVHIFFVYFMPYISFRLKGYAKIGYPEEYVRTMKKELNYIAVRYLLVNTLIQTILFGAYYLIGSEITDTFYARKVFVLAFVPSFGYNLFLHRKFSINYKEAIRNSGADIAVDFNNRMLNMIINWKLEAAALAAIIYFAVFFPGDYLALMIFSALGLTNYLVFRMERFLVVAKLRDAFRTLPLFTVVLQLIKMKLSYDNIFPNYALFGGLDLVIYTALWIVLGLTLTLSVASIFKVRKELGFYTTNIEPVIGREANGNG